MAATDLEPIDDVDTPSHAAGTARGGWRCSAVVVLMVAMWAGIFLGFFDKTAPGTMTTPTFCQQAGPICAATKAQLAALPKAFETTNHVDRANVVAQTNVDLRAMIEQLRAIAPTADRDGQHGPGVAGRLVDLRRQPRGLRLPAEHGQTARFYESTKSSATEQISKPIDRFAYVNNMDDCDTPQDMA